MKRQVMFFYHRRRPRSQKSCFQMKNRIGDRLAIHDKVEPSSTLLRDRGLVGDVSPTSAMCKNHEIIVISDIGNLEIDKDEINRVSKTKCLGLTID